MLADVVVDVVVSELFTLAIPLLAVICIGTWAELRSLFELKKNSNSCTSSLKKKQIKGIKDEEGAEDWLGFYKSSCTV